MLHQRSHKCDFRAPLVSSRPSCEQGAARRVAELASAVACLNRVKGIYLGGAESRVRVAARHGHWHGQTSGVVHA